MIRRPPRSTLDRSSAASDVYKRQDLGTDSRGIGTYLFGQPPNGPGIRPTPYSTNMAINTATYDNIKTLSIPHGVGYVWCGMIWDLLWKMVDVHGNPAGINIAINLVNEGMRLQPCSPGSVSYTHLTLPTSDLV